MKKILTIGGFLSTLILIGLLAGCENTVQGFGRDMQANGKAITKSTDGSTKQ